MSATTNACSSCWRRAIDRRNAHYYCVIVLVRDAHDPQPLIAEGEWHGEVLRAPRGAGGFGYDPLFLDPALGKTGAELRDATRRIASAIAARRWRGWWRACARDCSAKVRDKKRTARLQYTLAQFRSSNPGELDPCFASSPRLRWSY